MSYTAPNHSDDAIQRLTELGYTVIEHDDGTCTLIFGGVEADPQRFGGVHEAWDGALGDYISRMQALQAEAALTIRAWPTNHLADSMNVLENTLRESVQDWGLFQSWIDEGLVD